MLKIIYSYNKKGYEAARWDKELKSLMCKDVTYIPFNHETYLDPGEYSDSVKLDKLYQSRDPRLMRLYKEFLDIINSENADAIFVNNCPPYHPDYLRNIKLYKALYSGDDPGATYMRNIPYLHAYDHVFFVAPGYSSDMDLKEKMIYAGAKNADWLPISVFEYEHSKKPITIDNIDEDRALDIVYVGNCFLQKLELLSYIKREFGNKMKINGFFSAKQNLYFMVRHGYPGWVRPVSFEERINIYRHAKIGINIHWNEYGLGNQRLYHLPANGVMQITDCADLVKRVYAPGEEIETYKSKEELAEKISYYLVNEDKRRQIAYKGYERTMSDYLLPHTLEIAAEKIRNGIVNA